MVGVKLAKGRPVFTDDLTLPGMLYGALLTSPHAHARIREIDTSKAESLPGVHAVLTYKDVPRVMYASGGQSYPNPLPYDQVSLDDKVRHVGDRVALVAADTVVTGIYGMNFDNMLELHTRYGYFVCIAFMLVLDTMLYRLFRRSGWL